MEILRVRDKCYRSKQRRQRDRTDDFLNGAHRPDISLGLFHTTLHFYHVLLDNRHERLQTTYSAHTWSQHFIHTDFWFYIVHWNHSIFIQNIILSFGYALPLFYPFDADWCHMGTVIKHPVPDQVKPAVICIFDIRALWRLAQSTWMSKWIQMTAVLQ